MSRVRVRSCSGILLRERLVLLDVELAGTVECQLGPAEKKVPCPGNVIADNRGCSTAALCDGRRARTRPSHGHCTTCPTGHPYVPDQRRHQPGCTQDRLAEPVEVEDIVGWSRVSFAGINVVCGCTHRQR